MAKESKESKEFKNEFFEQLKKSVVPEEPIKKEGSTGKLEDLLARKEQLTKALEEETDSIKKMTLRNEIAEIESEIAKLTDKNLGEEEKAEDDLDKKEKEEEKKEQATEEQEEVNKEEVEEEEKQKEAKSLALREEYHAALLALYNHKIVSAEEAKAAEQLMTSRESFDKELELEAEMYRLRDEYLSLGNEDPYTELRTELIKKERIALDPMESVIRNEAKEFKELQKQIMDIDEKIADIDKLLMDEEITEGAAEKLRLEREELETKKGSIVKRSNLLKERLTPIVDEKLRRLEAREQLDSKFLETLTKEDRANYNYQQKKSETITRNTEQGIKQEYRHLNERIENREIRIKELKEQLKSTPINDFEGRLNLLTELNKEATLLNADRESQMELKHSEQLTPEQRIKNAKIREEKAEVEMNEFVKSTDDVRAVVAEQSKIVGQDAVANPVQNENPRNVKMAAAAYATVAGGPNDTLAKDVLQYQVAKQVITAVKPEEKTTKSSPSVIPGLEDKVYDIEDVEQAQKYLDNNEAIDEKIVEANRELLAAQKQSEEITAGI